MKRLDEYIKRRHEIAKFYDSEFRDLPIKTPWQTPNFYSSYHLYPILIKDNSDLKTKEKFMKHF